MFLFCFIIFYKLCLKSTLFLTLFAFLVFNRYFLIHFSVNSKCDLADTNSQYNNKSLLLIWTMVRNAQIMAFILFHFMEKASFFGFLLLFFFKDEWKDNVLRIFQMRRIWIYWFISRNPPYFGSSFYINLARERV